MRMKSIRLPFVALLVVSCAALDGVSQGPEVKVMMSGGFTAAYRELVPEFERDSGYRLSTAYGASMGNAPDSIPNRLRRGESADVLILASPALDQLVTQGKVVPGSRVDLAESIIGMAVRKGAAKPDIHSVDALRNALLNAKSIAFSGSASGVYLSTELFQRLGIANQIRAKCKKIESEMVGTAVARGDVEIGFQQMSELLPIPGIDIVGALPSEVQRVTIFSGGVTVDAKQPTGALHLLRFLASPAATQAIEKSGMRAIAQSMPARSAS